MKERRLKALMAEAPAPPRARSEKSPVGARYCVKCASPLEEEERAKITVKDEQTRQDIAELRKLVEKSLNPPVSAGGSGSSPGRTS